jgi:hypothetical protein
MANYCWNWVSIEGPKETLDIIEERFKKYDDWQGTFTEFSRMVLGLEPDVIPEHETVNEMFSRIYIYGTKWWRFEIERVGEDCMNISGDSAWSPPIGLLTMMTNVFDIRIEGEYSEPGCNFGGFYTIENGECEDNEMTYFEYELVSDRKEAIGRLINDMNEEFIDMEYAEKHNKPHLTEEEWNEVLTEINNV